VLLATAAIPGLAMAVGVHEHFLSPANATAWLPIIVGGVLLVMMPLHVRRALNQTIKFAIEGGALVTRQAGRRTALPLADVQELTLLRLSPLSAAAGDDFVVLTLIRRRAGDLSPRARRALQQTALLASSSALARFQPAMLHATWCQRPLIDVAALLATHVEDACGHRPVVSAAAGRHEPTSIGDLPRIRDWNDPPVPRRPGVPPAVYCTRCRYHLRGLSPDGACPECGTAIRWSLEGYPLTESGERWLTRVRRGSAIVAVAGVAGTLSLGVALTTEGVAAGAAADGASPWVLGSLGTVGASTVAVAVGGWSMTAPDPVTADQLSGKLRRYGRVLWLFPVLLPLIVWLLPVTAPVVSTAMLLAVLVPVGCLLAYTGALLGRADRTYWSALAYAAGILAGANGLVAAAMTLWSAAFRGVPFVFPSLALALTGAARPAGTVALESGSPAEAMVQSLTGAVLLWAPVVRLWVDLRSIERRRCKGEFSSRRR